jgi:hypothetical protein
MLLLERNNHQIKFDIKVTIATDIVYCMYLKMDEDIASAVIKYNINKAQTQHVLQQSRLESN